MQEDPRDTIRRLAALAGLPMTDERIAALAATLPFVQAGLAALSAVEYGDAEPAGQFRPRPESSR
jgi:hypothetical protein